MTKAIAECLAETTPYLIDNAKYCSGFDCQVRVDLEPNGPFYFLYGEEEEGDVSDLHTFFPYHLTTF